MAFIPIPLTVKVVLEFNINGKKIQLTFHVFKGTNWSSADMTNLADVMTVWWNGTFKLHQPQDVSLEMVTVTDQASQNGQVILWPVVPPIAGSWAETTLPGNVTLAIQLLTNNRGRSYRGRSYIPALTDQRVTLDLVTSATLTAILQDYAALISQIAAEGYTLVVASRFHNGAPRVQGITTAVTAVAGDNIVDSQRRRLEGRGT